MNTILQKRDISRIVYASVATALLFSLTACFDDKETPSEKIGNAATEVSDGIEEAAEELDPNRTTGEKVGDAIEDAGENIKDAAE